MGAPADVWSNPRRLFFSFSLLVFLSYLGIFFSCSSLRPWTSSRASASVIGEGEGLVREGVSAGPKEKLPSGA